MILIHKSFSQAASCPQYSQGPSCFLLFFRLFSLVLRRCCVLTVLFLLLCPNRMTLVKVVVTFLHTSRYYMRFVAVLLFQFSIQFSSWGRSGSNILHIDGQSKLAVNHNSRSYEIKWKKWNQNESSITFWDWGYMLSTFTETAQASKLSVLTIYPS